MPWWGSVTALCGSRAIPWIEMPFGERSYGLCLSWSEIWCTWTQQTHLYRLLPHCQSRNKHSATIPSRWDLNIEHRAEMKERAERDCWLTSGAGSKSGHKKEEAQAPALDSYWSKKAISKRFLSMPAVCKYSVLELVVHYFVSHQLLCLLC